MLKCDALYLVRSYISHIYRGDYIYSLYFVHMHPRSIDSTHSCSSYLKGNDAKRTVFCVVMLWDKPVMFWDKFGMLDKSMLECSSSESETITRYDMTKIILKIKKIYKL